MSAQAKHQLRTGTRTTLLCQVATISGMAQSGGRVGSFARNSALGPSRDSTT